jgi:hypothetical protein
MKFFVGIRCLPEGLLLKARHRKEGAKMKTKVKVKKAPTKKEMQTELDMFRKLSMQMVANKIFLEYKMASSVMSVEPEHFFEECMAGNFIRLDPQFKDEIWRKFMLNMVTIRKVSAK